jgi:predicted DNA-binding transcriptional regulator AlpA
MTTSAKRPPKNSTAVAPSQLLTAPQVMDLLNVSRVKLHYMMQKDGLPYIKLGEGRMAAVRFSAKSLEAWLSQNERHTSTNEGMVS